MDLFTCWVDNVVVFIFLNCYLLKEGNLGYSTVLLKEGNPGHVQEVQEKEPMDELFLFLLLKHCDHRRTIHSSWSWSRKVLYCCLPSQRSFIWRIWGSRTLHDAVMMWNCTMKYKILMQSCSPGPKITYSVGNPV